MPRSVFIPLLACLWVFGCQPAVPEFTSNDWPVYLGDAASSQFSQLGQITPENANQLEVAWQFRSGDADSNGRTQIQCNPIVINGVLYATSPKLKVFALDAATGSLKWMFDPYANQTEMNPLGANRGVTYWTDGKEARILFTANQWLYALDAQTGEPIASFGENGRSSLLQGLGRENQDLFVISNTPGLVFRDKLIIGTRVSENAGAAPGHIRAFNIKTGTVDWVFHTIPQPGQPGHDTWPADAWKTTGGANSWAGMALDEKRGVVYVPTGSAAYDFYGGDRHGQNLYANCLLALDAAKGTYKWHFQTVHHDMWDRDLPAPPNLVTVNIGGKSTDAVAQVTKSGFVFVLDRDTGKPLFPVEEIPVPASDLPGESAWPTQPVPVKPVPFARQILTEAELTQRTPEAFAAVKSVWEKTRWNGRFIPPSKEGTVIFPGFDGGAEWGGAAWDQDAGLLYVNSNEMAWILTMIESDGGNTAGLSTARKNYLTYCAVCHGKNREGDPAGVYPKLTNLQASYTPATLEALLKNGKGVMPSFGYLPEEARKGLAGYLLDQEKTESPETAASAQPAAPPFTHTGYNRFLDPDGYPAVKPPWGQLSAIDLHKGEIRWQVPLGDFPEARKPSDLPTGSENYGGPVVTRGGVVFIAAAKDGYFRVFDKKTGKELWKYALPAGGYATPATYAVNGKQFVVIACGGGKMGTQSGDVYVAFALPEQP